MSSSGFARIRAFVAVGTLLIAAGIARAESGGVEGPLAVVASSAEDSDFGWQPAVERRHHFVKRHVPHVRKVLAHHTIRRPHLATATTRHERPSLVVADNMNRSASPLVRLVSADPLCSGGISWNMMCPGAQVIGVTY